MRIGYDAKRLFLNNTGLGNYGRWLISTLASFYPNNSYFLYTPKSEDNARTKPITALSNTQTILPKRQVLTSWWRTKGIIKYLLRDGVDIYHGLSHELPYGIRKSGIKSVLTVHDLIFIRFPQYFGMVSRAIYLAKLRYACRVADRIIAISQRTKDDLIELLDVPSQKIDVVYQGCDASFKTVCTDKQKAAVLKKYNIQGQYILSVGTIEERKNLLVLIKAMARTEPNLKLVVVGKQKEYAELIKRVIHQYQLTDRMIFLSNIDFADLPALYQAASVFVYPSRYEGFGIPILEALESGIPVIAATGSCLEEAGGPGSLYTIPDDDINLAYQINRVLTDTELRQKMIATGHEYARNFDDDKLAAQLMAVYQNTMNNA
ncbi:glycosyltransferase family 4 protein [Mucilaginibacter myungsuensis]|uniref:Glycosyltransferase family 4 protein n=1 Tax=Mucilaginibacter myungsuensis TaxID=649104 RepID=A0A929PXL7_9SPHI|nr:glycosyltransferase family 1 protein [Mucilaginibacter myungsuensis]MBE9662392.1 glycosyltransferase family 4 protein [Mucilaginibacter myungsuensis]MDN3599171.1 glycosyltransferase family 1 protein [Mucilaginibacter myungsuensis]